MSSVWVAFGSNIRRNLLFTEYRAGARQVVGLTEQTQVVDRCGTSEREGLPVLDGQKVPLAAAPALAVDERALRAVSLPHGPLDLDRDVA